MIKLSPSPDRVFINSLPKSGTHLLAKTVELFGYREHFAVESAPGDPSRIAPIFINYREVKDALAREGKQQLDEAKGAISVGTLAPVFVDPATFDRWLASLAPRRYIMGHALYTPALSHLLAAHGYHHLFILRDPRAVVVSLLDFILETRGMPRPHFLQEDFRSMSPRERIEFILNGGMAPRAGVLTQSFTEVYLAVQAWESDSRCLVVRFEDLVGSQGGGSVDRQHATIERIARHMGHSVDEVKAHLSSVFDTGSRTFRLGQIDGWRRELDADSLAYLQSRCASLCQVAGYAD